MQKLKVFLAPFALLYGTVVWIRNFLFDYNFFKPFISEKPTICVGNLSTGGEGKTPHVEFLIELLKDKNKVAVLSRGYGRKTKGYILGMNSHTYKDLGDEPTQYLNKYPEIDVAVSEKRAFGLKKLFEKTHSPEIVLLDDAFQHRWVKPGLSILLTNFNKLFVDDYLLPMGRLRESKIGSKRADIIFITKCPESLDQKLIKKIEKKISPNQNQRIFFTGIDYSNPIPINPGKKLISIEELRLKNVLLVTGIAQPKPLLSFLEKSQILYKHLSFPDHHDFSEKEINKISVEANKLGKNDPNIILTTEKDAIRLKNRKQLNDLPVYYIPIKVKFLNNQEKEFEERIMDFLNNFT